MSGATLDLVEASRTYTAPGAEPVRALQPTTLSICAGELVGIVGPSGSGKTTLLNLLGLLDRPSEGSYVVDGTPTEELGEADLAGLRARRFGFVFQSFHLLGDRSAAENVELGMLYQGLGRRERRGRALEALVRVGLSARATAYPPTLSGGEAQRVAIARAVAAGPTVLLCDEPTGNLDQANSATVVELLRTLNAEGLTVVIITHNPDVAELTNRRLVVQDGVVAEMRPGGPTRPTRSIAGGTDPTC